MEIKDILNILSDSLQKDLDEEVEAISTGSVSLDIATDIGGIPKNRLSVIYGPGGSGKTTIAMTTAKEVLLSGGKVLYVDMESTLDTKYFEYIVGIDFDEIKESIVISRPTNATDILNSLVDIIASGYFDLIIFDSIGAIVTQDEVDKNIGERTVATTARLLSPFLRKVVPMAKEREVTLLFINQVRSAIGSFFTEYTMPGGNVLNHQSSMIIELYPSSKIKSGQDVIGMWVRATVKKNKVGRPYRTVKFPIIFGEGVNIYRDVIELAKELGVIKRRGAFYVYEFGQDKSLKTLGRGLDNTVEMLYNNQEVFNEIVERLKTIFITKGGLN